MDQFLHKATEHLRKYGLDDRVMTFDVSSATVDLAAQAVGTEPERIAKSLTFLTPEGPVMILAAGDARVDNKKYKSVFHTKAKMIPRESLEEIVGFNAGGVCPFGVNEGVRIFLDDSLKRFDTIYPAAGTAASAVRLTIPELLDASEAEGFIDVCKLS